MLAFLITHLCHNKIIAYCFLCITKCYNAISTF